MLYCQQFKEKMLEWKEELEKARVLLGEFRKSGNPEKAASLHEALKNISNERKEFKQVFQTAAKQMIENWCPGFEEDKKNLMKNIRFDENNRIIISGLGLSFGHSRDEFPPSNYCPSLIKSVLGGVDCQDSQVKQVNIEEIGTLEDDYEVESYPRLRTVDTATFRIDVDLKSVPELEEVKRLLCVIGNGITSAEKFKEVFPKLKKIGKNPSGFSVRLLKKHGHLKPIFEKLKRDGELEIEGTISFII